MPMARGEARNTNASAISSTVLRGVMITGDYEVTARAIASQAGLNAGLVVDGPTIARRGDDELRQTIRRVAVFARFVPTQKRRIVQALKANGQVVSMTGDGVNDAPSVKAADIGIAMGGRGTDVAREAASLVLLDDDFGSIVRTIRLGRRIYDNLRKGMAYIIAVHAPIAGLALLPPHWAATYLRASSYCVPGDGDPPGMLDGVRGRERGGKHNQPATATG